MSDGIKPAFPMLEQNGRGEVVDQHLGLTKRELFAAMAMQGIASAGDIWPRRDDGPEIAIRSVRIADALIAALNEITP